MLQLSHAGLWVHDQDEALAFYTDKLGMEIRDDVTFPELGGFRWLTVGPAGQPGVAITLMAVPGPPVFDADTSEQLKALVAKGVVGGVFFRPTTARATTRSSRAVASSSSRSRRSARTAWTRASATRPATSSAWCRRARPGSRRRSSAGSPRGRL